MNLTELKLRKLQYLRDLRSQAAKVDERKAARFVGDPSRWAAERASEHVWSKQAQILNALVDHRRVAVRSCHGIGKSFLASLAVGWWLDCHPSGDAFVVTTAPTFPQVRAILWRYIRRLHRKAGLRGTVNQTEWHLDGELVAFGRKPADHDESAFQGIHARNVLVVLDEACGIPEQLWVAADALTTNEGCRILAIGNPDNPASYFAKVCAPGSGWHTVGVSAFDSPNLTGEDVPTRLAEMLISKEWVEEKAAEWGVDNPIYASKILGEFPSQNPNSVVRVSDLSRCRIRPDEPRVPSELLPVHLGVDVGGGGDLTVVRERAGSLAGREWTSRSDRPEDLAPLVLDCIRSSGATVVKVDSIGIGWGLIGELRNAASRGEHGAAVIAVNVAERSCEPAKYANLRAEMWWKCGRELSAAGAWDLSHMEASDATCAELLEVRWELDTKTGRIKIESKDDVRSRCGGRSTDHADALLMAYYMPGVGTVDPSGWIGSYASAQR